MTEFAGYTILDLYEQSNIITWSNHQPFQLRTCCEVGICKNRVIHFTQV